MRTGITGSWRGAGCASPACTAGCLDDGQLRTEPPLHFPRPSAPANPRADSFATRRIRLLRKAIPAGRVLRPSLPSVIAENSEACPVDKVGHKEGQGTGARVIPPRAVHHPLSFVVLSLLSLASLSQQAGKKMLPDSSLWVSELATTLVDMALKGRPYVYKPSMTKKPNNSFKWLLPLVLAGQVRTASPPLYAHP